jgi:predicted metal-dependent phosphoesterase TrpH
MDACDRANLRAALVRVDLHVHSSASFDCTIRPESVAARSRRFGLAPVFLTDHDTIDGAVRLRELGIGKVVVGEEVMTSEGELIGLFLARPIPSGLAPTDAVAEIKSHGGLVYLEHPYDQYRRHLSEAGIEAIADLIDIVEVFNGRSDETANRRADELRATLGVAAGAGSDAHSIAELGSVYVEMEDFDGAKDFLSKLPAGKIVKGRPKFMLAAEARLRHLLPRL